MLHEAKHSVTISVGCGKIMQNGERGGGEGGDWRQQVLQRAARQQVMFTWCWPGPGLAVNSGWTILPPPTTIMSAKPGVTGEDY